MVAMEHVVLVDERDRETGVEEKLRAHEAPLLHRAVSVLVCNSAGALLMQRRAVTKYHSAGLWSNTCCGHPRPGEMPKDAAARRLREEMGVVCDLHPAGQLIYRLSLENGLFEHELNRLFVGTFDGKPQPNPEEVGDWKWTVWHDVGWTRVEAASTLTPWFGLVVDEFRRQCDADPAVIPAHIRRALARW